MKARPNQSSLTLRISKEQTSSRLAALVALVLAVNPWQLRAEMPGDCRPKPIDHPLEQVGATGVKTQAPDSLPKSRAPLIGALAKGKRADAGKPAPRGRELLFNTGWKMIESPRLRAANGALLSMPGVDTRAWYEATVPGTVLTTLVNAGVYPDPYYGLNNLDIPESLNKQDYWYRTEFTVPKTFVGGELWLDFEGINYYAEIWFNGHYLGHITGAFIRGRFPVTGLARPEATNVLAVLVAPPPDPGMPREQSVKLGWGDNGGRLCLDGPTFFCTEGWGWIPPIRDRATGIWQDVVLRATGPVTLGDPQVVTALPLPETSRADVTVQVELRNVSGARQRGVLQGAFEGVRFEQPVTLQAGEIKTVAFAPKDFPQLTVAHPRLWWPNGSGNPELYHLQLKFVTGAKFVSDQTDLQFGIREISYELEVKMPDEKNQRVEFRPTLARGDGRPVIDCRRASVGWQGGKTARLKQVSVWPGAEDSPALKAVADEGMGPYLVVKVNGRKIFCHGGNWGMDDALKRVSRAQLEPYIRLEQEAHLNMIRNWAGQSTSETFYELCDQYGILVWNDFWMSTEGWNYSPADEALFLRNAADALNRFRNHPCIAIWCGRNEGMPPESLNAGIDRLVRELDGTRYYQPNSRLVNLRTSGPWGNLPPEKYFVELNRGFNTEVGASSIPSAEAMRAMMAPADLWPLGDGWAYHDLHGPGGGIRPAVLDMIARRYGEAADLEDLCRKAQMVNYEAYRAMFEGYDSRLWNDCSGVLIWMSHPSWPSAVEQLYTWDYEPNAAYFGAQKGGEPVHIQMNVPDCKIAVINHRFEPLVGVTVNAAIYDLSGRKVQNCKTNISAAANACTDVCTLDGLGNGTHLFKLELRDAQGRLLSDNFYWYARDEQEMRELNGLPKVTLRGRLHSQTRANKTVVEGEVKNPSDALALAVKLTVRDAATGGRILPAYYSDNYFSLLPGERRKFRIECGPTKAKVQVSLDGWNIEHASLR